LQVLYDIKFFSDQRKLALLRRALRRNSGILLLELADALLQMPNLSLPGPAVIIEKPDLASDDLHRRRI
jgi:hypothetical protein